MIFSDICEDRQDLKMTDIEGKSYFNATKLTAKKGTLRLTTSSCRESAAWALGRGFALPNAKK